MLDKYLKIARILFYSIGILTCIVLMNKPSEINSPTVTKVINYEIPTKAANSSEITYSVDPNLIGATILILLTVMIIIGALYAFIKTTTKTKTTKF